MRVQKGAVLIVHDQRYAIFIATSALTLGLFTSHAAAAVAAEGDAPVSPTTQTNATQTNASTPASAPSRESVPAPIQSAATQSVVPQASDPGVTGLPSVPHPATADDVPAAPAPSRETQPLQTAPFVAWTTHRTGPLAAKLQHRTDNHLAAGRTRIVDVGRPGIRMLTYRFMRRGGATVRTLLASRIVRMPRARVIAHGVAAYASLAHVAEQGFTNAMNLAGSAIRMIATAYTAGCVGCSGITASGVRAGFGVIAVDPRVIPLGTRLFIPGYGRAVAGDTGGAILGNRVDLGMNSQQDAMQYGRRSVTVYVLRTR